MRQIPKTPVTIIGGYLGCGKTTLINHLLRHANGERLAILVNDFGELAIDADLIEADDGDVISLTGGCVCCSYGDDLSAALISLQSMPSAPDKIIIETSGVALPGAIGRSLTLLRHLMLQSIVVVADALTVKSQSIDKYLADTIERQLSDADLIVLNKLDLVTPAQAAATTNWLSTQYPHARLAGVTNSQLNTQILLENPDHTELDISSAPPNNQSTALAHDPSIFQSVEISLQNKTNVSELAKKLSDIECALVRAKGFATDIDGTVKTIQVVGQRWSVSAAPAGVSTGIVCIGKANDFTEQSVRKYCGLQ